MKITGITAEYNPFHKGHRYHIEQTRNMGATHIVAVMSGNYVQRGEFALLEKTVRAKSALLGGVDLVIELPVPYAIAPAEKFAWGAITLLDSLGVVDSISFGSESGNAEKITEAAKAVLAPSVQCSLQAELKNGISFAKARESAVGKEYGREIASLLTNPNDTLGVEYMKALILRQSKIVPWAVTRFGVSHDSDTPSAGFASASLIRQMVFQAASVQDLLPEESFALLSEEIKQQRAPADYIRLERAILSTLRRMSRSELSLLPDISEGLENRIFTAVRESSSLMECLSKIKTKRYSLARIRRILLSAFLGINKDVYSFGLPYIRILGMNNRGQEILRAAKEKALLPIVTRSRNIFKLGENANKLFQLECIATDLYMLSLPDIFPCGLEASREIITM